MVDGKESCRCVWRGVRGVVGTGKGYNPLCGVESSPETRMGVSVRVRVGAGTGHTGEGGFREHIAFWGVSEMEHLGAPSSGGPVSRTLSE